MLADRVRMGSGKSGFKDIWGTPGSAKLIAGDGEEGFFGEVPASEFITGDVLASQVGISRGTSQHSTAGWLKFAYKGEIQFVAKKPIRYSISWDAIYTANCVYGDSGDKTVVIDGKIYKVTLMRALEPTNDPKTTASATSGVVNHYSEWNRLMCQIHEQAIGGSWDEPDNIESDIGILKHSLGNGTNGMYNDADLVLTSGYGSQTWCQELAISTSNRLFRGGYSGVSQSGSAPSSPTFTSPGYSWRPVLRLVADKDSGLVIYDTGKYADKWNPAVVSGTVDMIKKPSYLYSKNTVAGTNGAEWVSTEKIDFTGFHNLNVELENDKSFERQIVTLDISDCQNPYYIRLYSRIGVATEYLAQFFIIISDTSTGDPTQNSVKTMNFWTVPRARNDMITYKIHKIWLS